MSYIKRLLRAICRHVTGRAEESCWHSAAKWEIGECSCWLGTCGREE